ncbi:MAG: hypothetical protein NVS4B11_31820 [Ktedonobacteraceae bacterium]
MNATERATAELRAWESHDVDAMRSLVSDDFVGRGLVPQPINKAQYSDFMKAMIQAIPDWSFNAHILHEHVLGEQERGVHVITQVTGTHTGDLVLPTLPIILPTGIKIALPPRQMEYVVKEDLITAITAAFSPHCLAELLAQLGMRLPR